MPPMPDFLSIDYATQIINPFLNSSISANHDIVERLSDKGEILF